MPTVNAFAAHQPGGKLEPFEYEISDLSSGEVDIEVETCGICHSDLSMVDDDWEMSEYPLVPGHEVIGKIVEVGSHVNHLEVGDRVGLGWHSGYCMTCDQCLEGDHNLCSDAQATIVGRHGGFADRVRAKAASVVKIPDALDARRAGPLLCGGITVFNPMVQFGLSPTERVAVVGIGGLGHLAIKFADAFGCHVTAMTSESKRDEVLKMGADETINSRDVEAIKSAEGSFDLVLSTVNVNLDWNALISTLRPKGRIHLLGAVTDPLKIELMPLMFGQRSLSSSPVGAPATIRQMLDFAARHKIDPVTEHFPMSKVNEAFDHLRSGKARYRIVLDRE